MEQFHAERAVTEEARMIDPKHQAVIEFCVP